MQSINSPLRPESPHLRWLQCILFGSLLLYLGRDILVPLSFSALISFVLYPICAWLEKRRVGKLSAILLSVSLLIILGLLLIGLLVSQLVNFVHEWPSLYAKIGQSLAEVSRFLAEVFDFSSDQQKNLVARFSNEWGNGLFAIIQSTLATSASSIVMLFLIPVYAVLILYYRRQWMQILFRLFPSEDAGSLRAMLSLTIQTYYNFIKGMAIVYLIVGILNSIGLLLLGIPHAFFFGFVASILTFVPYVGIIVGSLLPITMAWITYDSIWYPVGIVGVFTFVHIWKPTSSFPLR